MYIIEESGQMPRRGPRRYEYKGAFDAEKRIEETSRKKSHISSKLLVHSEQSRLTLVSLPTFFHSFTRFWEQQQ